jgi:hypothetical protein
VGWRASVIGAEWGVGVIGLRASVRAGCGGGATRGAAAGAGRAKAIGAGRGPAGAGGAAAAKGARGHGGDMGASARVTPVRAGIDEAAPAAGSPRRGTRAANSSGAGAPATLCGCTPDAGSPCAVPVDDAARSSCAAAGGPGAVERSLRATTRAAVGARWLLGPGAP